MVEEAAQSADRKALAEEEEIGAERLERERPLPPSPRLQSNPHTGEGAPRSADTRQAKRIISYNVGVVCLRAYVYVCVCGGGGFARIHVWVWRFEVILLCPSSAVIYLVC